MIVILALASSVVLLNAPPSRPESRDDAERFAARLTLAFDRVIATGETLRVSIDAKGYSFQSLKDDAWTPVDDAKPFARAEFGRRTAATIEIEDAANDNARALGDDDSDEDDEEEKGVVAIALDPLGGQTPFEATFSNPDGVWTVRVTEAAGVSVSDER